MRAEQIHHEPQKCKQNKNKIQDGQLGGKSKENHRGLFILFISWDLMGFNWISLFFFMFISWDVIGKMMSFCCFSSGVSKAFPGPNSQTDPLEAFRWLFQEWSQSSTLSEASVEVEKADGFGAYL